MLRKYEVSVVLIQSHLLIFIYRLTFHGGVKAIKLSLPFNYSLYEVTSMNKYHLSESLDKDNTKNVKINITYSLTQTY